MHHDPARGPTRPPPLPTFPLVCLSHLRPPLTRAPVPEPRRARRCRNSIPARMSGAGGWTWWEELGCWVGGQSALAGSYFSDLSVTVRSDVPRDDGYKAHQGRGSHGSPGVPSGLGPQRWRARTLAPDRGRVCWSAGRSLGGHYCSVHDESQQAHHIRHLAAHKRNSTNRAPSTVQLLKTRVYRPPDIWHCYWPVARYRGGVWHAQYEH